MSTQLFDEKYYPRKDIDPSKTGTHMQKQRPRGGWPNTCADPRKPNGGRKIRAARKRLADRMAEYKAKKHESGQIMHMPGSLKCK